MTKPVRVLREAATGDGEAIAELLQRSAAPLGTEVREARDATFVLPSGDDHFTLLLLESGGLVGIASAGGSLEARRKGLAELYQLVVDPAAHPGAAATLLRAAAERSQAASYGALEIPEGLGGVLGAPLLVQCGFTRAGEESRWRRAPRAERPRLP